MRRGLFQQNLSALERELNRRHAQGLNRSPRQQQRIDQLRAQDAAALSGQELEFLDAVGQMDLMDAERRRDLKDAAELRGYKQQVAQGIPVDNNKRFEELLGAENRRRSKAAREKTVRNIGLGTAAAGAGVLGLGAAGYAAAAANGGMGMFPFSSGLTGGDDALLAAQQFKIERELEERLFQDQLAQRTAVAQTDLDNDLMAMQQKQMFQADLDRAIAAQQMQSSQAGGAGVDVIQKIETVAAGYMAQGMEPQKAFTLAQQAVSMDGRSLGYL